MKAIVLPDYNANVVRALRSLEIKDLETPHPAGGQVLIRVAAAPCNPSDIAFMRGGYNIKKPVPVVMGFECTGTVVETGDDPNAAALLGKRISCFTQGDENGTWSEYFMTDYRNCLTIRDELNDEQAAALCINPFTAYALFSLVKVKQAGAIVQNGASGQIGIFIRKLARLHNIPVINLVRKQEHVEALVGSGEKWVLNMGDPDFESSLRELAHKLNATIAFDAVAGDVAGMMLNALPAGAELIIYGGLSGKPAGMINPLDIIFKAKSVKGFNLGDWKTEIGDARFGEVSLELQQLLIDNVIATQIQGIFPLDQVHTALEQYIRNMSSGKILFRP